MIELTIRLNTADWNRILTGGYAVVQELIAQDSLSADTKEGTAALMLLLRQITPSEGQLGTISS